MIVSCPPFRVSFAGGSSDVAQFNRRQRGGVRLNWGGARIAFAQ